jgi:hypothetical protein
MTPLLDNPEDTGKNAKIQQVVLNSLEDIC